ncbi:MAG: hypothetical protein V1708_00060 [Candidatus Micrarchaeota archaeon]
MVFLKTAITLFLVAFVLFFGCLGNNAPAVTATPAASPAITSSPIPSVASPAPASIPTPSPAASPSPTAFAVLKGVSLSPKSFSSADFNEFMQKTRETGNVVLWAGDWNELASDKGAPAIVEGFMALSSHRYVPVVEAQFFTQSDGKLLRPLDGANKKIYLDSAAAFAKKYSPPYLGLGIEVNILYEKSPADFEAFAAFFSDVYDAVKAVSPQTKVFTVFQLEKMKGLRGGLFGGTNDGSKAEWSLLEKFPKADLVAFSTYPGLIYKSPAEIPENYYSEIALHISKPVAFTEIGWHSAASPAGWEGSEAKQAEFVGRFFALNKGLRPELAVWSFMYDPQAVEPFNSMGLISADGTPKSAWGRWFEEG